MYEIYTELYRTKRSSYSHYDRKNFGSGFSEHIGELVDFSYLGNPVFELDKEYTGDGLLGFTNGKEITKQKGLNINIAKFVQLHEEEHVKDMSATEMEVDKRALKKFKGDIKTIENLLFSRWGPEWRALLI